VRYPHKTQLTAQSQNKSVREGATTPQHRTHTSQAATARGTRENKGTAQGLAGVWGWGWEVGG